MSPPPGLSREARIYLAIWRKAYRERDTGLPPVSIKASNTSNAQSMVRGFYRAIRPYRIGEGYDSELSNAAEKFVVTLQRGETNLDPCTIVLQPRATLSQLEAELAALGIADADLFLPDETRLAREVDEIIAKPGNRPANPFYTRED